MSHKVNLVRVLTAATGNSTPITLGAAYSQLFMLPSEAGAMDGRTYSYLIVDGNNWEMGRGVYTASGTTLARTTIIASRIAGTLGTSRISLSGTAQVRFVDAADDMDGMRGTRAVTGTTDTLNNSDLGFVVTYSNAAAVAVSLAQASVSNLFLDGWACYVKNKGAGAVTITPATSTIDGAATLVLAQNQGALIWSDGTNYQSFALRNDIGIPVRADASQSLTAAQQNQAQRNAGLASIMRGYLAGLVLSTAGSSATFGITAGVAANSTSADMLLLTSTYTKTTSAWAVGTGNGALDTGTVANNQWYHVYLIKRTDTGVVDLICSLSAASPTLPTNYTLYRYIGSMLTDGSAQWTAFSQIEDMVYWGAVRLDLNSTTVGTTSQLVTLSVPPGFNVRPLFRAIVPASQSQGILISGPIETDVAAGSAYNSSPGFDSVGATGQVASAQGAIYTNTSGQIRVIAAATSQSLAIHTRGYINSRGRFG
jgi:hypothetical protein